jgi:hypothetical protein
MIGFEVGRMFIGYCPMFRSKRAARVDSKRRVRWSRT